MPRPTTRGSGGSRCHRSSCSGTGTRSSSCRRARCCSRRARATSTRRSASAPRRTACSSTSRHLPRWCGRGRPRTPTVCAKPASIPTRWRSARSRCCPRSRRSGGRSSSASLPSLVARPAPTSLWCDAVTVGRFDEHPRGASGRTRLIRLGFADTDAAENALSELGLWAAGGPADDEAAVVTLALSETVEPDLAVAALERLAAALPDSRTLLAALREYDGLRRRLLGVLGASVALGDHLAAHPHDWVVLLDDDATLVRPSRLGLQWQLLDAVRAHHTPPTRTQGSRAGGTGADVVAALRAAYRRCLLALAARDLTGEVAVEDVAGELAD